MIEVNLLNFLGKYFAVRIDAEKDPKRNTMVSTEGLHLQEAINEGDVLPLQADRTEGSNMNKRFDFQGDGDSAPLSSLNRSIYSVSRGTLLGLR